jgi:mono/diheme cytochrome c family protein
VDNHLTQDRVLSQIIIVSLAIVASIVAIGLLGINFSTTTDPYVKEVLALEGNIENGRAIFQINCAGCHGIRANGDIGPSLIDIPKRKSKTALIQQVISGKTPPMPKFQPSPQIMADLLAYLQQL